MVGGAVVTAWSTSRTRSHRRVNQGLPGMQCGAISLTLPKGSQWQRSTVSSVTAEAIGTFANLTRMKRGKLAVDGMGGGRDGFLSGGVWTGGRPALPLSGHPPPTGSCPHASEPQGFLVGES